MKKTLKTLLIFCCMTLCLIFCLTACGDKCEHTYDSDCDTICNECKETRQASAEHTYYGDCDAGCHGCFEERAVTAKHNWKQIINTQTCIGPEACEGCGAVNGAFVEHTWIDADCDTPKTCSVCQITAGEALGHDYSAYVYDDHYHYIQCALCGVPDGEESRAKHTFDDEYACECGCEFIVEMIGENKEDGIVNLYNSDKKLVMAIFYMRGECVFHTDHYYNENGDLLKVEHYSGYGALDVYELYAYDANGNMIKKENYLGEGTLVEYELCAYDANGNMIKKENYLGDGTLVEYELYAYDANGNVIKKERYYADGTFDDSTLYTYDENGKLVKETISRFDYDENGEHIRTIVAICDEHGFQIEEWVIEHHEEGDREIRHVFECDENGYRIKDVVYQNGNLTTIFLFTNDENGRVIKEVMLDAQNENQRTVYREYYENGHPKSNTYYRGETDIKELEYHYHENGIDKSYMIYNENGELIYIVEYDEDGNVILEEHYE